MGRAGGRLRFASASTGVHRSDAHPTLLQSRLAGVLLGHGWTGMVHPVSDREETTVVSKQLDSHTWEPPFADQRFSLRRCSSPAIDSTTSSTVGIEPKIMPDMAT
jgi:hypothetical protein